jgi:2,2-dialkylglycine decarboxylase (pyruvate)
MTVPSTRPPNVTAREVTDWLTTDRRHVMGWRHGPQVVFEKGHGLTLTDVAGNEYLDFVSGHISLLLGHNHPALREALLQQADRLWSHYKYFAASQVVELAETLAESMPGDLTVVNFASVGSEANEVAMRMARGATGGFDFVAVISGLYGGTFGVESLNSAGGDRKRGLGPMLMPSRAHAIVAPYCYRCPLNLSYPSCDIACLKLSDELIERFTTGQVAAIFAETIMNAGGVIVPPDGWLPRLKQLAEKWGALLVLDEIPVSPAKTGRMWAFQQFEVVPDIVTLGKSFGGGLPLAAAVTSPEIAERARAAGTGVPWAGTFAGDPLAAAVALRQLQILIDEDYPARAAQLGKYLMEHLLRLKERYAIIGDVRGRGLFVGLEIVKDRESKERDGTMMHRIRWNAVEEGLIVAGNGNVLKMFPALIVTHAEIDEGVEKLDRAIRRALNGEPRGVTVFTDGTLK